MYGSRLLPYKFPGYVPDLLERRPSLFQSVLKLRNAPGTILSKHGRLFGVLFGKRSLIMILIELKRRNREDIAKFDRTIEVTLYKLSL